MANEYSISLWLINIWLIGVHIKFAGRAGSLIRTCRRTVNQYPTKFSWRNPLYSWIILGLRQSPLDLIFSMMNFGIVRDQGTQKTPSKTTPFCHATFSDASRVPLGECGYSNDKPSS